MGNWPKCPYYLSDGIRQSYITCEDTRHYYDYQKEKDEYLEKYCCSYRWKECVHAAGMNRLYERLEEMADKDKAKIEKLEHQLKAQEKEATRIRKENTRLQRIHKADEHLKETVHKLMEEKAHLEKVRDNLQTHNIMLTNLAGYLMVKHKIDNCDLTAMHKWSAEHDVMFELFQDPISNDSMINVVVEDKEISDDKGDGIKRAARALQEAGREETKE